MARTKQTARRSTSGPAPRFQKRSTPVADAWGITEIAENILARLPMKDLLLVQRICTAWRELIKRSPVLQELLFMRPRQSGAAQAIASDGTPIRQFNPLLVEHMPMWFSTDEAVWRQTVRDAPWAKTVSRLTFLRRDASWRDMLLAQPPFTVFESVQRVHARGGDSLSVGRIHLPDGVRMGLAYDQAVETVPGGSGGAALPNNFYALMDGRTTYDAHAPDEQGGSETSRRVFGGVNRYTLLTQTTRGCTVGSLEASTRDRMKQRQFTSAGFEPVEIEHRGVARTNNNLGDRHSWCTVDGYEKR